MTPITAKVMKLAFQKHLKLLREYEELFLRNESEILAEINFPNETDTFKINCDLSKNKDGFYYLKAGQPIVIKNVQTSELHGAVIEAKLSNSEIILNLGVKVQEGDLILPVANWRETIIANLMELYSSMDKTNRISFLRQLGKQ